MNVPNIDFSKLTSAIDVDNMGDELTNYPSLKSTFLDVLPSLQLSGQINSALRHSFQKSPYLTLTPADIETLKSLKDECKQWINDYLLVMLEYHGFITVSWRPKDEEDFTDDCNYEETITLDIDDFDYLFVEGFFADIEVWFCGSKDGITYQAQIDVPNFVELD